MARLRSTAVEDMALRKEGLGGPEWRGYHLWLSLDNLHHYTLEMELCGGRTPRYRIHVRERLMEYRL